MNAAFNVRAAEAIAAYSRHTDPNRIDHTVQVTSFGGAGTTAVCNYLVTAGVDLQKGPGQWPFRHRRVPPTRDRVPDGFRVVYLLGDPRNAVVSVFRRGLQIAHFAGLHEAAPGREVRQRLVTLEQFLAAGIDDFALADHVDRWRRHPSGYPVLFVRYELLADAWEAVRDFVGLSREHSPLEVRARRSDWRSLPSPLPQQIDAMYGDLARDIEAQPPVEIA